MNDDSARSPMPGVARAAIEQRIFEGLNPEQARAVTKIRGPVVILAGAGSGKTTTITRRIANQIVTGGLEPKNILAVTFTTKAAAELIARLKKLGVSEVPAKTFHAAALSQLTALGQMEVDLLPAKTGLLWRIRNELPKEYREHHLGELAGEIERAKVNRVPAERYLDVLGAHVPPIPAELMQRVYDEYERRKRSARKLDFEDLMELTIRMYETDAHARARFERRYRAITVDEYQDVNQLQQALLDCWLGERDDVCVVGDDYQAIFGFTGASPSYLAAMRDRYENATVITLETNYRSTPQVLAWANRLAPKLGGTHKQLQASVQDGPEPRLTEFPNEPAEVTGVVERIRQLVAAGTSPSEIAVIYRINARSTPYEQELHRAGIPFQVARGGFIERDAWRSARKTLARSKTSTDLRAVVEALLDDVGYVPDIRDSEVSPQEYTRQVDLAFIDELTGKFPQGRPVGEFVTSVERDFATYSDGETREAVRLTTYHLAKGLEWDAVFLPRLNDGELPYWKSKDPDELAEERRLFYVGLTRARRVLELSTSGIRFPSRFIEEAAPPKPRLRPATARNEQETSTTNAPSGKSRPGRQRSPGEPSLRPRLAPSSWHPFRKR